ncbi:MAG: hypothetical protein IIX60_05940 [Clostridia bacterium]|nr:hypothetical protein [Clostridia bacterium]
MIIFPAIDIIGGKAVRLFKGDYNQMTVYNDDPSAVALDFKEKGATHIHLVDLGVQNKAARLTLKQLKRFVKPPTFSPKSVAAYVILRQLRSIFRLASAV